MLITGDRYKRAAHLRPFLLPGGDQAVREPRRSAIGLLHELFGENFDGIESPVIPAFSDSDLSNIKIMLSRRINCVHTSSAGRLFDAVASLIGLRQVCRFEGQAAMELEFIANQTPGYYEFAITKKNDTWIIDWEPMIRQIMMDHKNSAAPASVSSRFHNTLAEMIAETARKIPIESIAMSGGCFQNKRLLESTIRRLAEYGFKTYWHQRIPTNDGGIALGQITAAMKYIHLLKRE
jgi:hydrogenase maturation protein HypF